MDWLVAAGCTHVAMESTGVYWKPLYNLLENVLEVVVVNAQHIKAVRAAKRMCGLRVDRRSAAAWPAAGQLHPRPRATRTPGSDALPDRLVQERTAEVNRVQKVLEDANIKLASVATDIMGASGRAMLAALVTGTTEAAALAQLARGSLRAKIPQLERALAGRLERTTAS